MDKTFDYIFGAITLIATFLVVAIPSSREWVFPLLFLLVSIGSFVRNKNTTDKILGYVCIFLCLGSIYYYWIL